MVTEILKGGNEMVNFELERRKHELQKRERNRIEFLNELYRF